jgi:hypothetical protein
MTEERACDVTGELFVLLTKTYHRSCSVDNSGPVSTFSITLFARTY